MTDPYMRTQILTAPPEKLAAYTCRAALGQCRRRNKARTLEAVGVLVGSLGEREGVLYSAYRSILGCLWRDRWEEAERGLGRLLRILEPEVYREKTGAAGV